MNATKLSRHNLAIHVDLAAFITLQDGQKTAVQLYPDVIDLVFHNHTVIWVDADVKSVFRAANQRGGAIEHEISVDAARNTKYDEAKEEIELFTGTRGAKAALIASKQRIIDEYNMVTTHTHLPLSMAQLALHRALHNMGEKTKKRKLDNEVEEGKVQAAIKEQKRAEMQAKNERKAKEAEESSKEKA